MIVSGPMNALRSRFGDKETIRLMAAAGFDAVDYTFNEMTDAENIWNTEAYRSYAKELLDVARDCGVHFNQAHAPFLFDWDSMWGTSAFESLILPKVLRSIECASLLGIPLIVVHPIHHIRYYGNEAMLRNWNLDYYRRILPYAKDFGVKIALENMWQEDPKRKSPDADVFSHPEELKSFLDELDDPFAVACVDVGHLGLAGEDPARVLKVLGKRVKALHLHDNRFHIDDHTLPFLGLIEWEPVMKALGEIGYEGDFTYEVTNYFKAFPAELVPSALRLEVDTAHYLISRIEYWSGVK